MTRRFACGLFGVVALAVAGCSGAEGDDGDSPEMVGGKIDAKATDDAVVAVMSPNKPSWICSGAVIAPRVVLTAGHCVSGGNSDKTGWTFEVFFGADRNHRKPGDKVIKVTAFHYPELYGDVVLHPGKPGASLPKDDADGDVAVLILAEPAPAKPIRINTKPLPEASVGSAIRFLGYGRDKPKDDPAGRNGVRKAARSTIAGLTSATVEMPAAPANPCHGDSGGPMLLDVGGVATIIGVGHVMYEETCVGGANYERTDRYADFLRGHVEAAR